jgi:hypothetical protein
MHVMCEVAVLPMLMMNAAALLSGRVWMCCYWTGQPTQFWSTTG